MPASAKKAGKQKYVKRHADGTVWAIGSMLNGEPDGYFEWFRKDGTKLRSGYFKNGQQTGEWITYDARGKPFKITDMTGKESPKKSSRAKPKRRK